MPNKKALLILLLVGLVAAFAVGCGGKTEAVIQPDPTPPPAPAPEPPAPEPKTEVKEFKQPEPVVEPPDPTAAEINASGALGTIYFEFDRTDLSDAARRTLQANSEWFKNNTKWNVIIEGHCDERGTIEYNIELGQRRAKAVRDYMSTLGVNASRVRAVSYGEERPTDAGHNESAWSKNRRAETKVE